ncbi:MAG: hypothetical protein ACKO38_01295 [Planctomycetota bacterium]
MTAIRQSAHQTVGSAPGAIALGATRAQPSFPAIAHTCQPLQAAWPALPVLAIALCLVVAAPMAIAEPPRPPVVKAIAERVIGRVAEKDSESRSERITDKAENPFGGLAGTRWYTNRLVKIENPKPLLADYPEFFEPIEEETRFEAPAIVDDPAGDLTVRAWRFSYNARGIIEMPNRLAAKETAVIMVHPWAIDDEWGWKSPEPNGVADFCTPRKNALAAGTTAMGFGTCRSR